MTQRISVRQASRRPLAGSLGALLVASALLLTPAAFAQEAQPSGAVLDAKARSSIVANISSALRDRYIDAELGKQAAQKLQQTLKKGAYDQITSPMQFANAVTKDLYEFTHDKHVQLHYMDPSMGAGPSDEMMAAFERFTNYGFRGVERLDGNIGYLRLDEFAPIESAFGLLNASMQVLSRTDALIVDLRKNNGGDPYTEAALISYLLDGKPRLLTSFEMRSGPPREFRSSEPSFLYGPQKPIYVLTSNHTFSAGEAFAYDVQALKRGTVLGETTAGGANAGSPKEVFKNLMMLVPDAKAVNAVTQSNWQGTGVKPDVPVSADEAFATAYERALKDLISATNDPLRRQVLTMALNRRKSVQR